METTAQESEVTNEHCSFCTMPKRSVSMLIAGNGVCICPNCALGVHQMLIEKTGVRTRMKTKYDVNIHKSLRSVIIVLAILVAAMIFLFFSYK